MIKRKKQIKDGRCSAPNCPLRYYHNPGTGKGWCRYHYGVTKPANVSEITRLIHSTMPVRKQASIVQMHIASPAYAENRIIEIVDNLPREFYRHQDSESLIEWRDRLINHVETLIHDAR